MLDISQETAERAKQREAEHQEEFATKLASLGQFGTLKETARIMGVSAPYVRKFCEGRDIKFLTPEESQNYKNLRRKLSRDYKASNAPRRVEGNRLRTAGEKLDVPTGLAIRGARLLWQRRSEFIARMIKLAPDHTLQEAADILGMSYAGLHRIAHEQEIVFKKVTDENIPRITAFSELRLPD